MPVLKMGRGELTGNVLGTSWSWAEPLHLPAGPEQMQKRRCVEHRNEAIAIVTLCLVFLGAPVVTVNIY